jgi:hypothetical protein
MPVTILPRRQRQHATMRPLRPGHQAEPRRVNVRVPSTAIACQEYRDSAVLLRDLGLALAAHILEATADALQRNTVSPDGDDTVVADVPHIPEPK